jgi:hypothetical protein
MHAFDRGFEVFGKAAAAVEPVRSTAHRRAMSTKPRASFGRLTISTVQSPCPGRACSSLGLAYPPSAETWGNQG